MVFPAELLAFAGFGAAILLVAWVPLWLERVPLTLPMLAVGVGFLAFVFTRDAASPLAHPRAAKLFPEVVLIVAVMGAALTGAYPVIAIDLDPAKLELAQRLGATHVVDAGAGNVVDQVLELTDTGVPWLIEAVGRPETMRQAVDCLRPGGTVVAIGLSSVDATVAVPINDLVQRQKRVVGSLYGSTNPRVDLPRIFALYLGGRLPLDELIGAHRPLAEVNHAYADLRAGRVGRTILRP